MSISAPARFSADGQLVAYASTVNGRPEVYVRARAGGRATQVSAQGGQSPLWSRRGRVLYYNQRSTIMRVVFDSSGNPGRPEPVMRRPDVATVTDIITNFFDELRAKVGDGTGAR